MPRIPVHTIDSVSATARPVLQQLRNRHGRITNVEGGLAHAPAALAVLVGMREALDAHATLDRKTREAVSLAVSAVNACSYGEAAHAASARAAGWSPDEILMIRRGAPELDPVLGVLLDVAREIVSERGAVTPATWQRALEAGWSEMELTELYAHVMVAVFTDHFSHYAESELDRPPAPPLTDESPAGQVMPEAPPGRRGWKRARRTSAPGWTGR